MPFAPQFAARAAYGERVNAARYYVAIAPQRGERVRYADSPRGASAYARTEKLPYQGQFRDRNRAFHRRG